MFKPVLRSVITVAALATVSFMIHVLTARALGVEGRGIYAAIAVITTLASGLAQLGLGQSFVFLYRANPESRMKGFILKASVSVCVVSAAIAGVMIYLNTAIAGGFFLGITWLTISYSLLMLLSTMSQVRESLVPYNLIRLSLPCLLLVAILVIWQSGHLDIDNIIAAQGVLSTTLGLVALIWLLRMSTSSQRAGNSLPLTTAVPLGWKYHSITTLGLVTANIDKVVLYIGGTLAEFGLYSIAIASSRILNSVQESVSSAVFAAHAGKDTINLISSTLMAFRLSFYPLLVIALVATLSSELMMTLVFGVEYAGAALPFSILCFDSVIAGGSWVLSQYFNAAGRPGLVLLRQALSLLPVLILIPFLPSTNTITWLALILVAGSLSRLFITIVMLRRDAGIRFSELLPQRQDVAAARIELNRLWRKISGHEQDQSAKNPA